MQKTVSRENILLCTESPVVSFFRNSAIDKINLELMKYAIAMNCFTTKYPKVDNRLVSKSEEFTQLLKAVSNDFQSAGF
jgi:hypothetical protein